MTPIVTKMEVYPVAGKDCMELNLSGAHAPYFTRNIVILTDSTGATGVGEVPGGQKITKALEDVRPLVEGSSIGAYKNTLKKVSDWLSAHIKDDVRGLQTFDLRTGVHVVTALEAPLLDLLGKYLDVPAAALLGDGIQRERVRFLCYLFYVGDRTKTDLPYDSELELNVKTKSTKQTGPGAVFKLSKKNFKRMGASLNLELNGSYEWQTSSTVDGESSVMNSYELGAALSLNFPRLVLPWQQNRMNAFRFPSQTDFKIYASQVNRARYFKMLSFGGSATLDFQSSETSHHSVVPFKLAYNKLQHTTETFDSITNANRALFLSLKDQFIPSMSYTYTYDDSPIKEKKHHIWWQTSITQSGNILSGIYALAGKSFKEENKHLLGNVFSQFVKVNSEIRYNRQLAKGHNLVGRLSAGVIYGYGNAENHTTPYNEQFYIGGANSIRAFTIRSIGPGRFRPDLDNQYGYIDQTGDLKFEANLEYRFPIFAGLNGAVFLDAGNIWLIHEDPNRPGGQLKWGNFLKDLALGTGVGLRYDLQFIVVRVDCGIGLHVPYQTEKSGYYNIPKFKDGLGFHLAIGYPF